MKQAISDFIRYNWLSVHFTNTYSIRMKIWMDENMNYNWAFDGPFGYLGNYMYFEDKLDAMAFKLRWS